MSAKYFLDTNIFVYSFDERQADKRERALDLISAALQDRQGITSTQVIQEFLNVATRKFAQPLHPDDCKAYMRMVLAPLCEVYPDAALYESALELQQETGYSFYDALILASALRGGCDILYSEDLQAGQKLGNLTILNPFT